MSKKIKLIIDTDIGNEVDDQFALVYALSRHDFFDIEAITVAPYRVSWQKGLSVRDGLIDGKNEAYRILRLFGIKHTDEKPGVYLGSSGFVSEGYENSSPAVEKIVEIAKKNRMTYICCLGVLTNVALAIRKEPKIAKKIKVIWLGTDNLLLDKFTDSNYRKDVAAFEEVVLSDVDLTVFPAYLGRTFVTSTYEFERNINGNNIAKYLLTIMNRFHFNEENLGIKTIYDIGPIAYLLHKDKFEAKEISPNLLIKTKHIKLEGERRINYVLSVPKNSFVWKDFLAALNSNENHYLKSKVFFTSDTHFGQERKIRIKQVPFKTVEEMNSELVRRWNSKVGTNDTVYHLGDFGDYEMVKKLNGKVVLICGNYEKEEFGRKFSAFREKLLKLGFADVIKDGIYLDEKILGERVYLTHKPTDHAKDAFTLFGHVHTLSLVKKFGFNVCTNYHYYAPIDQETAKRYLEFVKNYADVDVFTDR